MEDPQLLDHLIQSQIPKNLLLDGKVLTCAKFDEKYTENVKNRLEEEFPEHIIGCREFKIDKKIVTVTSRNRMTIRTASSLKIDSKIQCDYFATSICSLIHGDSMDNCHVFFGSVIGDLIDWRPNKDVKPIMRKGHKGMIFSIVTDGTRIFTISDDRTIRMWSFSDRECGPICTVFGHTARPFAICVDPIHRQVYTGGIEQTIFCWKYDELSIDLTQKLPISMGVIRKITKIDNPNFGDNSDTTTLAITAQNGDLLKIHVDRKRGGVSDSLDLLRENVVNFAHLNEGKIVILTGKNDLILYDSLQMDRIIFRCGQMRHMTSSAESVVTWHQNVLVVITKANVYRLKLSMNIIAATCFKEMAMFKTIDGYVHLYNFRDAVRCYKRFRPENSSMIPTVFSVVHPTLIIGTAHGELYHTDLCDSNDRVDLSLTRQQSFELFGGKEVTCIRPISKTHMFSTLGKTGMWSTIQMKRIPNDFDQMEILNSRSFSASSRVAWPSQFIEWNDGKELLIVGFYGTSLIIWNSTTGLPIFETYCGGGHRIWHLTPSNSNDFNFDYIKDTDLCRQKIDLNTKCHVSRTAHASPIVAASGSRNYLATVSLDGHLSIGTDQGQPISTCFVGENLLCTDILETFSGGIFEKFNEIRNSDYFTAPKKYPPDEKNVFILAGGGKSKLSLIQFHPEIFQKNPDIFWIRHVSRPDEGRVVAVKTCPNLNSHYFIASYSSGILEVFRINEKKSFESMSILEIEDSLGIATKIDYFDRKLIVGTSGSHVLRYRLTKDGKLVEQARMKLADRSGVTSLTISADGTAHFGCDSGHVYRWHVEKHVENQRVEKVHSHLSTVVGIVVDDENGRVHSTSLDCVVLTSATSSAAATSAEAEKVQRKATIIDMPNGMVKTGKSNLVVVGDGIQIIENL